MNSKAVLTTVRGYVLSVGAVLAIGLLLLPLRPLLPATAVMLLFVPVIVTISRLTDLRVAAVAAAVAFLTLDFLFVPPYYTFTVQPLSQWIGLLVFLAVALIVGQQTSRLRTRQVASVARQSELELVNRASFRVASEESPEAVAEFIVRQVTDVLGAARAALFTSAAGGAQLLAEAGTAAAAPEEPALIGWVLREGKAIGFPPVPVPHDQRPVSVSADEALPGATVRGVYLPLQTAEGLEGVLVAVPSHAGPVNADEARLLAALANLSATCLERQRLEEEASHAEALREADRLKSTLVSSVSHELKTPLAAVNARVTGLLEEGDGCDAARVREELTAVVHDLGRLDSSIRDLLDVSRLESATWESRLERFDVAEILGTVIARLPASQRQRVRSDVADLVPDVCVDFTQLARALTNLIENALAYSAPDAPVRVVLTKTLAGEVEIAVEDRGQGITDEEKDRVFEKFYRGEAAASEPGGSGLGLTIAREIVRGLGGTIHAEDASPHGARLVVVLPACDEEEPG